MKKNIFDNKIMYTLLILFLIAGAIFGVVKTAEYVGYASLESRAGYIYEIIITQEDCTESWDALFGIASWLPGTSTSYTDTVEGCTAPLQKHLFFNCMDPDGSEVYASNFTSAQIDWDSVRAATIQEINDYLGHDGTEFDSANNTFTLTLPIDLGLTTILAPSTFTKGSSGNPAYPLYALKDPTSGALIFAARNMPLNPGFDTQTATYQLMLPTPNGTAKTYYIIADPYDICPGGSGFGVITNGVIYGDITDSITSLPIQNVSVYLNTVMNFSDVNGFYNITAPTGYQYIIAIKPGYDDYINTVNISSTSAILHDISMIPSINGTKYENGTVTGYVTDILTNNLLANATVTIDGVSFTTNSSGFYNISMIEGIHNLLAVKQGYENYINNVTILPNDITIHNISMSLFEERAGNGTVLENGTITGVVKNIIGIVLENVSISAAGIITASNSSGGYTMTVIEGTHNIAATRPGYQNYISDVNVSAGSITIHNITMNDSVIQKLFDVFGTGLPVQKQVRLERAQRLVARKEGKLDYEISIKKILRKLKIGTFLDVPITISNFRSDSMNVDISIKGDAAKLASIDKKSMTVDSETDGEFTIKLIGNVEVGIYEGEIEISGDLEQNIPITILVYSKDRLPIEGLDINLEVVSRKVYPTGVLKYKVDIQNLLREEEYNVILNYKIKSENGSEEIIDSDETIIQTAFSVLKSFDVPEDFTPGDYVLTVEVLYLNMASRQSVPFKVSLLFYKYSLYGIPVWMMLAVLSAFAVLTLIIIVYKKHKRSKQRYKTKLNLNTLPKPGDRSAYIGNIAETSTKTYFDLDKFQIHTLIAGASGSGKSIVAYDLVEEALLKKVAVMVFDPSAQWSGFLRKNEDKEILNMYSKFGMKKSDAKAFNGNIHRVSDGREIIDFKKNMVQGSINVFIIDKLKTKDIELFVSNVIKDAFDANLPEEPELKYLMVYDGIHTLLPKYGGSGKVFIQIERAAREFRKWGIGLILISSVLSDFPKEVSANINTELQLRTRDENDLNKIKEEYGDDALKSVVKAATGTSMIENSAYNDGSPYFAAFRPPMHSLKRLTDDELSSYEKYNLIIRDLEYQLEQLKQEKLDVFDLELELKLAKDKVGSGSFNMVSIYLDGLTPRMKAEWEKIGKTPQKMQIRLANEGDIDKDIEEAKKENKESKKEEEKSIEKTEEKENIAKAPQSKTKDKNLGKNNEKDPDKTNKKEENAKEIIKEELSNNNAVSPEVLATKETTPEKAPDDKINEANNLINQISEYLNSNNKKDAIILYNNLTIMYKEVPAEYKKDIFNKCKEISNKLRE